MLMYSDLSEAGLLDELQELPIPQRGLQRGDLGAYLCGSAPIGLSSGGVQSRGRETSWGRGGRAYMRDVVRDVVWGLCVDRGCRVEGNDLYVEVDEDLTHVLLSRRLEVEIIPGGVYTCESLCVCLVRMCACVRVAVAHEVQHDLVRGEAGRYLGDGLDRDPALETVLVRALPKSVYVCMQVHACMLIPNYTRPCP